MQLLLPPKFVLHKRVWLTLLVLALTAGLSWAVFYPVIGIRQNLAEAEFQKAWLLYQDRKYDAAIEKLSQVLLINPEFHWARRFLAQAYYYSGQTDAALEEYAQLVRALPHDLTLRQRIQWLETHPETEGEGRLDFLRILPQAQGYRYNRPTFVGQLPSDQLAVLSLGNLEIGNMLAFSAQGEPIENRHRVSGKLNYPMAFAVNQNEIWITDYQSDTIHRLDRKTRRFLSYFLNPSAIGRTGSGELEFRGPAGICHREGEFVVADSGNNRLQRIADDGRFIAFIRRPPEGEPLQTPFGVWCDEDSIWVTETAAGRISHFDRYGVLVEEFSPPELTRPRHISYDSAGEQFLVADEVQGILRLNRKGELLGKITGYTRPDGRPMRFARAYAAVYDSFRNLYVADYGASEVVQFVPAAEKFAQLYLAIEKINAAKFPIVGIYVTVSAGSAEEPQFLTTLSDSDFRVYENDAPVGNLNTDYLQRFSDILSCVLLVARSEKMREFEGQMQWVLDHLLTKIREKDGYRVISHGHDVRAESDFINSRLKLLATVRNVVARGEGTPLATMSTALYDAISELLPRLGKRAVIYLTAGEADDDALEPYDKARLVAYARAHQIPIYVVSFEHPQALQNPEAKTALEELATKTGGKYYRALGIDPNLDTLLRGQKEVRYVLGYQSLVRRQVAGQYVDIRVSARFRNRRGLDVSGYFIP
ncbi:MAG: tetratricopeptide repeat protein [Turneriella sp.]|nr:tetratricopeptide repeat protein [Turneriella sp.]